MTCSTRSTSRALVPAASGAGPGGNLRGRTARGRSVRADEGPRPPERRRLGRAAFRPACEAGHPSTHARCDFARGHLRLKPILAKMHGQEMPESVHTKADCRRCRPGSRPSPRWDHWRSSSGTARAAHGSANSCHTRRVSPTICVVKTMHTEHVNHDPGIEIPAHWIPADGTSVRGRVGQLRAGLRQPGSAELHRDELRHQPGCTRTPPSGDRVFSPPITRA